MQFTEEQACMFFELSEKLQKDLNETICLILGTKEDCLISSNLNDFDNKFNDRNAMFSGISYALMKNMLESSDA